jgi:thiamine biosynthesis lipoprotein
MGTTYHVTYFDFQNRNFQHGIDSILLLVNRALSTYDPLSEVSVFNRDEKGIEFRLPYFYPVLRKAREVYQGSGGAFDPTVMPLVSAWGFGPSGPSHPTNLQIDSILGFIGFNKLQFDQLRVSKTDPRVQLDFGGIGQGFGVDIIAGFLRQNGIENMLVELGGEGIALGKNLLQNRSWQIAILDPASVRDSQLASLYLSISGMAFTTSGNYFNYREIDGKKYGHTISPTTGYPVANDLLSASVFAKDCTTADAWATAFMVMGLENSIEVLHRQHHLQAILFYQGPNGEQATYMTTDMHKCVISEESKK